MPEGNCRSDFCGSFDVLEGAVLDAAGGAMEQGDLRKVAIAACSSCEGCAGNPINGQAIGEALGTLTTKSGGLTRAS